MLVCSRYHQSLYGIGVPYRNCFIMQVKGSAIGVAGSFFVALVLYHKTAESATNIYPTDRHRSHIFASNGSKWNDRTQTPCLRVDKHNLIDNPIFSPRVNLLFKPSRELQARLTYSTGFRAPQAYDEDLHVTAVGGEGVQIQLADNLKEERSNSFSGHPQQQRSRQSRPNAGE